MSQNSIVVANGTGAAVRTALNNALDSLSCDFSGASEPGTTWALMKWADTTNNILKIRNLANTAWISFMDLTTGDILTNAATATTATNVYMPIKVFNNLAVQVPNGLYVRIIADYISLFNASYLTVVVKSINVIVDITAVGADGLDSGSMAANTWYSIWVIYNKTTETTAAIISLNASSPVLPSGYTYFARVGWARTTSSANQLRHMDQFGGKVNYLFDSGMYVIASGAAGTYSSTTPVWVTANLNNFIPSTAREANTVTYNNYEGGALSNVIVAPNNYYAGIASATGNIPPLYLNSSHAAIIKTSFGLETYGDSRLLYWVSSAAGGAIYCTGWEDNL